MSFADLPRGVPTDCGGVKKFLASQAQEHPGVTLEVGCINGGPINQVEQEEMVRPTYPNRRGLGLQAGILAGAKADAEKMITRLATMSYCDLLARFE